MLENLSIETSKRTQILDITAKVQAIVSKQKINEGFCIVFIPHTTAAITIQENADASVQKDLLDSLSKLAPEKPDYLHSEGNSDAHIKAALVGNNVIILIRNNKLLLGQWGGCFFAEFDGPRERNVLVMVIKT